MRGITCKAQKQKNFDSGDQTEKHRNNNRKIEGILDRNRDSGAIDATKKGIK